MTAGAGERIPPLPPADAALAAAFEDYSAEEIIRRVSAAGQTTRWELRGPKKRQAVHRPRVCCYWLLRHAKRYSLPAVGGYLGGRDHSTVMHGIRQFGDRHRELLREVLDRVVSEEEAAVGAGE